MPHVQRLFFSIQPIKQSKETGQFFSKAAKMAFCKGFK